MSKVSFHPNLLLLLLTYLSFSRFDVPYDCSVELSPLGYQFFTDIFETFDKVRVCNNRELTRSNIFITTGPGWGSQYARIG